MTIVLFYSVGPLKGDESNSRLQQHRMQIKQLLNKAMFKHLFYEYTYQYIYNIIIKEGLLQWLLPAITTTYFETLTISNYYLGYFTHQHVKVDPSQSIYIYIYIYDQLSLFQRQETIYSWMSKYSGLTTKGLPRLLTRFLMFECWVQINLLEGKSLGRWIRALTAYSANPKSLYMTLPVLQRANMEGRRFESDTP